MKDFAVGLIAWGYLLYICLSMCSRDSILDTKPREYIGDTITIMNEQLMITDYTLDKDRYYLSNGAVIDRELLFKLKE